MRTFPLPFVSLMGTIDKSVWVSLTSRSLSPTLMPIPDSINGLPWNRMLLPSPATALPSATVIFLYEKSEWPDVEGVPQPLRFRQSRAATVQNIVPLGIVRI
jgi:hypothetical protein